METTISSKILKRSMRIFAAATVVVVATLMLAGCGGSKVRPGDKTGHGSSETMGPPEIYGPAEGPTVSYGPEPVQLHPVTLVFGPGMARGLAQVGVLRALVQNHIPIAAVYGTEMGALVAALYAVDSNINHFEWNLLKFKDEIFVPPHGILNQLFEKPGDASNLERQLALSFGSKNIADTRLPLRIAIQEKEGARPIVLQQGKIAAALRAALARPGFFEATSWDGVPATAATAGASLTALSDEARAGGGAPVIVIDTSETPVDPSSADLVIRPDLGGIRATDFNLRTDAAYRGKKAVEDHIQEIRKWVGLTNGPEAGK